MVKYVFCISCGAEMGPEWVHCPECGTNVAGSSIHRLMLKDDEKYRPVLHEEEIMTLRDMTTFLQALDFVIEAWRRAVNTYITPPYADDIADKAISVIMECRMAMSLSEVAGYEGEEGATYIDILKTLKGVREPFKKMANTYSKSIDLAIWYDSLPTKLTRGFSNLHLEHIKIKAKRDI